MVRPSWGRDWFSRLFASEAGLQGRRSGTTDHANDGGVGWPHFGKWDDPDGALDSYLKQKEEGLRRDLHRERLVNPYALPSLVCLLALPIIFLDWNRWYLVVAGFIMIGLGLWLAVTASNLFCDSRGTRSNKGRWAILVLGWGSLIALSVSGLLLIPWREP
jgi:hypothetical protein